MNTTSKCNINSTNENNDTTKGKKKKSTNKGKINDMLRKETTNTE